ncbi:hypothetical protein GPJ56_010177 [Histomonas meleagridis]|uniref:uncharacterized protein n=1 Tax=Histomonas meleagridis TaxID=135588 RepID=UPI00355A5688|nr:hypothetical protein GPJ56_010177 [Histomonas meleagridis]KAH0804713.1 hypothetical protein GO595_002407 [Histomonas meleagridis]
MASKKSAREFKGKFSSLPNSDIKISVSILILCTQEPPFSTIALSYLSSQFTNLKLQQIPSELPLQTLKTFWKNLLQNTKFPYNFDKSSLAPVVPRNADTSFYIDIISKLNDPIINEYIIQIIPQTNLIPFAKSITSIPNSRIVLTQLFKKHPNLINQICNSQDPKIISSTLAPYFGSLECNPSDDSIDTISKLFLSEIIPRNDPLFDAFSFFLMRKLNIDNKFPSDEAFAYELFSKLYKSNHSFKSSFANQIPLLISNKREIPLLGVQLVFDEMQLNAQKSIVKKLILNQYQNSVESIAALFNMQHTDAQTKELMSFVVCASFSFLEINEKTKNTILNLLKSVQNIYFECNIAHKLLTYATINKQNSLDILTALSSKSNIISALSVFLSSTDSKSIVGNENIKKLCKDQPSSILTSMYLLGSSNYIAKVRQLYLQTLNYLIPMLSLSAVQANDDMPPDLLQFIKGHKLELSSVMNFLLNTANNQKKWVPNLDLDKQLNSFPSPKQTTSPRKPQKSPIAAPSKINQKGKKLKPIDQSKSNSLKVHKKKSEPNDKKKKSSTLKGDETYDFELTTFNLPMPEKRPKEPSSSSSSSDEGYEDMLLTVYKI